jgi:cell division protein FtsB
VKRWPLLLAAVGAALALWVLTSIVSQGFEELARARAEREGLEHRRATLKHDVRELETTLSALRNDPRAVESVARLELGWVRPGEVVVVVSTPTPAPGPTLTDPVPTPILTLRE